ncbi:MAG: glycosyltransferase family 4 protein [Solirubrobacteraceae bacterium]
MVLFVHNRYRTIGGEERVVEQLAWLVREHLREDVQLIERDSASLARPRAAIGLLRGGRAPRELAGELASDPSGDLAPIVHAHNLLPAFGWRTLAAAREAGARVVWHLHQYRLVCANGVTFTRGADCTRCHGRNTLPGVALRCRGGLAEAATYGLALALWQRRAADLTDAVIVPSEFARGRLRALGAPLAWDRVHVLAPPMRAFAERSKASSGRYALVASRLSAEKGVDSAIRACHVAGVPLMIAGEGPLRPELEELASGAGNAPVSFLGQVSAGRLSELRAGAAVALVPSRSENFSTAAAEAMACGLPVVATRVGGTAELVEPSALVAPDDPHAMAETLTRLWGDEGAGENALARVRAVCAPEVVAAGLEEVYRIARRAPA